MHMCTIGQYTNREIQYRCLKIDQAARWLYMSVYLCVDIFLAFLYSLIACCKQPVISIQLFETFVCILHTFISFSIRVFLVASFRSLLSHSRFLASSIYYPLTCSLLFPLLLLFINVGTFFYLWCLFDGQNRKCCLSWNATHAALKCGIFFVG